MITEARSTFVSYSRLDSEFAQRLAKDLKSAGASVWLDEIDIRPGQRWARAVQDALNASACMLVILSPSSADSTNVDDEISFALDEHKVIIPALYRDCKIPFRLRPYQYVDFRTDYAQGLRTLLNNLLAGTPSPRQTMAPPPAKVNRPPDVHETSDQAAAAQQVGLEAKPRAAKRRKFWIMSLTLSSVWFLGLLSGVFLGGWVHVLLLLAIIFFILGLVSSRRVR